MPVTPLPPPPPPPRPSAAGAAQPTYRPPDVSLPAPADAAVAATTAGRPIEPAPISAFIRPAVPRQTHPPVIPVPPAVPIVRIPPEVRVPTPPDPPVLPQTYPDRVRTPISTRTPSQTESASSGKPVGLWFIGSVVLVIVIIGVILLARNGGNAPTALKPTQTGPSSSGPSNPIRTTRPPPRPRPTTPSQAVSLTRTQATTELQLESTQDQTAVEQLQGWWVSQVSSKCEGVRADIGPGWAPNGRAETAHITLQQILAFNLSLSNRFHAITVRQTQVGISHDRPKSGVCANKVIWMSVVPITYSSALDANAWCDAHVPPIKECQARYVAGPGETSTTVART